MDVSSVNSSFSSLGSLGSSGWELEGDLGRDALKEICCSSLSRLLDLDDNKLEILLGAGDESTKKDESGSNIAKNIATKLKTLSHRLKSESENNSDYPTLTFGVPINSDNQTVFLQLANHLEEQASEDGLFRKSGSRSRTERLINDLSTRPFYEITSNKSYQPHDYASVFKQFISELPEPLMLSRHMEAYRQVTEFTTDSKKMLCLKLLVLLLPPTHHVALSHLLRLLSVVANDQENRMDSHNLALIFAPNIFYTKTDTLNPQLLQHLVTLLELMISNAEEVFEIPKEVRVVANKYMKKKGTDEDIPVEIYSSSCQRLSSEEDYHQAGKDRAAAELAQLYEMVRKMPDGPKKTHFLKRFESGNKLPGSPSTFSKAKKFKENLFSPKRSTPKLHLPQGVESCLGGTPMRAMSKLSKSTSKKTLDIYATPLKPRPVSVQKMETDV